jgi:charged multivesicular body protein 3
VLYDKGEVKALKTLAKSLVHSRRAKERIHESKARMNSCAMQLQQQMGKPTIFSFPDRFLTHTFRLATIKITGCMKKSAEVMKNINQLINVPEVSKQMMEMQMEMEKANLIDEMVADTLDMDVSCTSRLIF